MRSNWGRRKLKIVEANDHIKEAAASVILQHQTIETRELRLERANSPLDSLPDRDKKSILLALGSWRPNFSFFCDNGSLMRPPSGSNAVLLRILS